jgi:hypothetical protein
MSSGALFCSPITIATGGALTSTTVGTSLDPAAYSGGATYAQGSRVTSGESVYESLQAGNTGHELSDTAWWVRVGSIARSARRPRPRTRSRW